MNSPKDFLYPADSVELNAALGAVVQAAAAVEANLSNALGELLDHPRARALVEGQLVTWMLQALGEIQKIGLPEWEASVSDEITELVPKTRDLFVQRNTLVHGRLFVRGDGQLVTHQPRRWQMFPTGDDRWTYEKILQLATDFNTVSRRWFDFWQSLDSRRLPIPEGGWFLWGREIPPPVPPTPPGELKYVPRPPRTSFEDES